MAEGGDKLVFDIDFKTPLTAPRPGPDPRPGVHNIPMMGPRDPQGLVSDVGGSSGGSIRGSK
jgi:hypothetical protein